MNIAEIAKLAGVSSAAVSRYFNSGHLSDEKREVNWHLDKKIKEVSDELKYQLSDMYTDPNGILSSIIKEFYDRLNFSSITGKNTAENLWKNLYYEKCANVWGEEFNDVKEVSDIYNEWESLKTELNKYSKQDFVINI